MSEETKPGTAAAGQTSAPDPILNLKSEFNRKFSNLEETNKQLLAQISALTKSGQPAPGPGKKVSELIYEDADAAAEIIKRQAKDEIRAEFDQERKAQAKFNTVAQELYREFPEVGDETSDLMKRAREIHAQLDESDKANPLAMKAAVSQAAAEFGVKPKSKRATKTEDSVDGFSTGGGSPARPGQNKKTDLDPVTEDFARMLNVKIDDPKVRERVKEYGKKKWNVRG